MIPKQELIIWTGEARFLNKILEERAKLGIPKEIKTLGTFEQWNSFYSKEATKRLLTTGCFVEDNFDSVLIEDFHLSDKDLTESAKRIISEFNLSSESINEVKKFILTNKLSPNIELGKNFEAYLTTSDGYWELIIEIGGNTRRNDINWDKSIRSLLKLFKTMPKVLLNGYKVSVDEEKDIVIVSLSDKVVQDDLKWEQDILPFQKQLKSYKAKLRPLNIDDYKQVQKKAKRKDITSLRFFAHENVDGEETHNTEESKLRVTKEEKRLKSQQTRYNKIVK